MSWPWRRDVKLVEPRQPINSKVLELQMAKEILAEVFHTKPSEVEEMIQNRLEGNCWQEKLEEELWPATFCLAE